MKPTYLYIKQHTVTGKLYFGKTTSKHPDKYNGSGDYWKSHIAKHGKEHIITLWYCLFYDKDELTKFALQCSKDWDIVDSSDWLNLKDENGLDGGRRIGSKVPHKQETKDKISSAAKGRKPWNKGIACSESTKSKIGAANQGKKTWNTGKTIGPQTDEHRKKISESVSKNKWYNNGVSSVKCLPGNEPVGFKPGRFYNTELKKFM